MERVNVSYARNIAHNLIVPFDQPTRHLPSNLRVYVFVMWKIKIANRSRRFLDRVDSSKWKDRDTRE